MAKKTARKRKDSIIKNLQNRVIISVVVVLLIVIGLSVSILLQKTNTKSQAAPAGFVTREGKNLMLNGSPYKFVGFNAYGMTGCWPRAFTPDELDAYFQSLPPASMTRIWAFKDYEDNIPLVIERAEANNQKIVMTLSNGLKNCEGGAYDGGEDNGQSKGADWFESRYESSGWLDYVKSTVTKFKDSPAVGMWEVSNEGGHQTSVDAGVMKAYYDKVADAIKAIDPNHLVSTGALAEYTYGGTEGYQTIHSGNNIDVVSFHEYDGDGISSHFEAAQAVSNALNKPIMVGETGVSACDPERAQLLKGKFDGYLAGGASGVLLWNRDAEGDGCGFESIGPNSDTARMVTEYVIPGIVITGTTDPTVIVTPTGVTPTFFCEGSCPTSEPTPTVNPAEPTESEVEPTDPSGAEPTEVDAEPTTPDNQPNNPRGNRGNGIWGFFMWLIALLMQLFQRLFH